MDYILWLPSWYPNKLSPFNGDFIQRHAEAVSLLNKIHVIYIIKDDKKTVTDKIKIEKKSDGNLWETTVYYHPYKTGLKFLDKIISHLTYEKIYKKSITEYFSENGKPPLVHVHVAMKAGVIALWVKKKFNIPFLLSDHWTGYFKTAKQNIYNSGVLFKSNTRKIIRNASVLIPVTQHLGLTINDLEKVPFEVVPNVVNTNLFNYQPADNNKFSFIHASTLNYHKNVEGIIRASKLLFDEGVSFELIIIGSINKKIITLVDDLKMNKIIKLHNQMPYEQVAKEMQQSSALVLFSRVENLPCVLLEALCCGLTVVSSDVGGIKEEINNTNGILVESENEMQLKEAMKKMIESYSFYNRKAIAEDASRKYNFNSIATEMHDIYKNFIK